MTDASTHLGRTCTVGESALTTAVSKLVHECEGYENDEDAIKKTLNGFLTWSTQSVNSIRDEIYRQFSPPSPFEKVCFSLLRLLPKPEATAELSIRRLRESTDEVSQSKPKIKREEDRLYQEMIKLLGQKCPYNPETENLEPKDPTKTVTDYQSTIVVNAGFSQGDYQVYRDLLSYTASLKRRLNPQKSGGRNTPATTYYKEYGMCFKVSDPVGIKLKHNMSKRPVEAQANNIPDCHVPFGTRMFMLDCRESDTGEKRFHKLGVCLSACSFNGSSDSSCSCGTAQGTLVMVEKIFEDPYCLENEIVSPPGGDEILTSCRPPATTPVGTYINWPTPLLAKKIRTIHEQYEQDVEMLRMLDRDCQENTRTVFTLQEKLEALREFVRLKREEVGVDQDSHFQCPRPIISGTGLESQCGKWLSSLIHQANNGSEKRRLNAIRLLNNEISIIMGRDINSNWFVKERSKRGRKKKSDQHAKHTIDAPAIKKKPGRKRRKTSDDRDPLSELHLELYQQARNTRVSGRAIKIPSKLRD